MHDATPAQSPLPERLYPPAISLREIWPYALLAVALLVQLYFVGPDEGATPPVPGHHVHEFVHHGRHPLRFPRPLGGGNAMPRTPPLPGLPAGLRRRPLA